jgi:rubrerythrin
MDGVGSTLENLKTAIEGEVYEYTEMYPSMLEQAKAEGHKAKKFFSYAVESEKVHAELYKLALEAIESGKDITESNIYLCPVCGHIEIGTPPDNCPICGVKAKVYIQIN